MQLDDEGGRTFLRVLIHLIMHDYAPLLSGALQLLFKHFSQRAEVLQAFKQVRPGPGAGRPDVDAVFLGPFLLFLRQGSLVGSS